MVQEMTREVMELKYSMKMNVEPKFNKISSEIEYNNFMIRMTSNKSKDQMFRSQMVD